MALIEGRDYYLEDELMVLTAYFLENRGFCCGNNCRHCPYKKKYSFVCQKWCGEKEQQ